MTVELESTTRLHTNLMAWLTTVNPAGRPDSVPVWFRRATTIAS